VTGLALTVSQKWLRGEFYGFLAILHAITVIGALLYLPFGKFFHIFQRPAQLSVKFYQAAAAAGDPAVCKRCGKHFASRMHIEDLNRVLPQVGFDYRLGERQLTWQEICPACKRKSLSLAQMHLREEARGCTHLSCAVYFSAKEDRLECPCHQGFFSVRDGSVLQGPPPRPLPQITLERNGARLLAVGVREG